MILLAAAAPIAWPQADFHKIKTEFQSVSAELEKHTDDLNFLREDDPAWIPLVARQWELGAHWVAAWLNARDPATIDDVKAALADLGDEKPQALRLDSSSFLVVSPGMYGNVFVVSNAHGRYRVAWTTASRQEFVPSNDPRQDDLIAAWTARPKGHDWTSAGPLLPSIIRLSDTLFAIDAGYDTRVGGTRTAQISFWRWDGSTAHPLLAQTYEFMIYQKVGTRVENGLLQIREKREYASFWSCGSCEGRQVDLNFRLTPQGIETAGETVVAPELDLIDDFLGRLIQSKNASDVASSDAIAAAEDLFPDDQDSDRSQLGMLGDWSIKKEGSTKIVCVEIDETGPLLFTLKPGKNGGFIENVQKTTDACKPEQKP